jgi:hypothetical protein
LRHRVTVAGEQFHGTARSLSLSCPTRFGELAMPPGALIPRPARSIASGHGRAGPAEILEEDASPWHWDFRIAHQAVLAGCPTFLGLLADPDPEVRRVAPGALLVCWEQAAVIDEDVGDGHGRESCP